MQKLKKTIGKRLALICAFSFLGACGPPTVTTEEVEYRKDEGHGRVLFLIDDKEPYDGFVTEKHPNGSQHFNIQFKEGLPDGNFTFLRDNGLPVLKGSFLAGERHGRFSAYGKAGELVFEKTYRQGRLDGSCNFYYPYSLSAVERFFEKLKELDLEPYEMEAHSNLRLSCSFKDDSPHGEYRAYYPPSLDDNFTDATASAARRGPLREVGSFDNGYLTGKQIILRPEVATLAIVLPTGEVSQSYRTDGPSFANAIEAARKALKEIPPYRNRDKKPVVIMGMDAQGEPVAPLWTTDVREIAIRDEDGTLLPSSGFDSSYTSYVEAKERAKAFGSAQALEESVPHSLFDLVGLDQHRIVVSNLPTERHKLLEREWVEHASLGAKLYLPTGKFVWIREKEL